MEVQLEVILDDVILVREKEDDGPSGSSLNCHKAIILDDGEKKEGKKQYASDEKCKNTKYEVK